jgi:GT2 family glycosyltransferase/glycosyltransferase involved in cell wall biosynthesis
MSYSVYQWLKTRAFDIVHCHEWRGLAFYTALAKRQGLCLPATILCVGAHSPVLWHLEGMNELADAEALEVDFMERESVALADVLWSPSSHMIAWMRREGWRLPRRIVKKPYILLDVDAGTGRPAAPRPELVFFGRLETRKGLDLFCDAIDRLVARNLIPPRVTFLGKTASVNGRPSEDYLRDRARSWPFPWKIVSNLDRNRAMAYLKAPDRVAVLPSRIDNLPYTVLECLGSGIPCVAAATGGIPEMLRVRDRDRILFAPTAPDLANRLAAVLRRGLAPAPMREAPSRTLNSWLRWHLRAAQRYRPAPAPVSETQPLVSICVTHRNRPRLLAAALDSIRRQDYPRIEVLLVDDGSDQPDAIAALDALEAEFADRQWRIIRQPNRYLGAARNAAIAAARGEFVMFMDDDNLAMPSEVRTFVDAARRSPASIFTCFLNVFQGATPVPERDPIHVWPFLGGALAPGLLRNVFGDANAFFRRDVFDRIGGFTEDFGIGCEDWELFARAMLRGLRLEVVPEPLVLYRQSPQGMLNTTSQHANRMRALRPYFGLLPSHLRPLVHLARTEKGAGAAAPSVSRLDHVQRAVVFGSGEAGRMALGLAEKCGWSVPWIVDNNPTMWDRTAHGLPVRHPESLKLERVDLVIIASLAGKPAISAQLEHMGFSAGANFVHFLDPVRIGSMTLQLSLP